MLTVEALTKGYRTDAGPGAEPAVNQVSFEVKEGEFFTLLGPSGCGKTTTLRCVAGLERPQHGRLTIGGMVVCDVDRRVWIPPDRREISMVFQSYAIWPHLSVEENVAFTLRSNPDRRRRYASAAVAARVAETLELVGLGQYRKRSATQLSGGQQQRLALARALAPNPQVLLLDEPLSNLDAELRGAMRFELKKLQRDMGVTTLYVTHDQAEALALSDRIAVMSGGAILQEGAPAEIYHRPAGVAVASFLGGANLLHGRCVSRTSDDLTIETAFGHIEGRAATAVPAIGSPVTIALRAEHIHIAPAGSVAGAHALNRFAGVVASTAFQGDCTDYLVELAPEVRIRVRDRGDQPSLAPSTNVDVVCGPANCLVYAGRAPLDSAADLALEPA